METGNSNLYMLWTTVNWLTGHIKLSTSNRFTYQIKSKWEETEKNINHPSWFMYINHQNTFTYG